MPTDIIFKSPESSSALSVNGCIYDLQHAPEYTAPLVQQQQQRLLLEINLDELNDNLYLSVELLFVAFNGVAGAQEGVLQAEINDIMGELALLCNECIAAMNTFNKETENIVRELEQTYRWLVDGFEEMAFKKLEHCGASSLAMSRKAAQLSDDFKALQQRSVKARSNTILQETAEYNRKEAAEKAARELEASQKVERINQEELVQQISKVQRLYDDAQQREEKESKKALALGIVSAIFGAIGTGLGAFAAAKNPAGSATAKTSDPEALKKLELAQKDADDKKEKSEAANNTLLHIRDKISTANTKVAALKKELETGEEACGLIEAVAEKERTKQQQDELANLKKQLGLKTKAHADAAAALQQLQQEERKAGQVAQDCSAAYAAAGKSLQALLGGFDKMAAAAASAEESIHAEKMKFLDQKFALEAEKRKSLLAMATFAEGIRNAKIEQGNAEVSVQSLHAAVEALGKVIGTLTTASLFWKQMSDFCMNMISKGLLSDLKDLKELKSLYSHEERVKYFYQDETFMMSFLIYLCQWVALNGLSGAYVVSAAKARQKCLQNIAQSPAIDIARKNAPALAESMSRMLAQRIQDSRNISSAIMQQQARLDAIKN